MQASFTDEDSFSFEIDRWCVEYGKSDAGPQPALNRQVNDFWQQLHNPNQLEARRIITCADFLKKTTDELSKRLGDLAEKENFSKTVLFAHLTRIQAMPRIPERFFLNFLIHILEKASKNKNTQAMSDLVFSFYGSAANKGNTEIHLSTRLKKLLWYAKEIASPPGGRLTGPASPLSFQKLLCANLQNGGNSFCTFRPPAASPSNTEARFVVSLSLPRKPDANDLSADLVDVYMQREENTGQETFNLKIVRCFDAVTGVAIEPLTEKTVRVKKALEKLHIGDPKPEQDQISAKKWCRNSLVPLVDISDLAESIQTIGDNADKETCRNNLILGMLPEWNTFVVRIHHRYGYEITFCASRRPTSENWWLGMPSNDESEWEAYPIKAVFLGMTKGTVARTYHGMKAMKKMVNRENATKQFELICREHVYKIFKEPGLKDLERGYPAKMRVPIQLGANTYDITFSLRDNGTCDRYSSDPNMRINGMEIDQQHLFVEELEWIRHIVTIFTPNPFARVPPLVRTKKKIHNPKPGTSDDKQDEEEEAAQNPDGEESEDDENKILKLLVYEDRREKNSGGARHRLNLKPVDILNFQRALIKTGESPSVTTIIPVCGKKNENPTDRAKSRRPFLVSVFADKYLDDKNGGVCKASVIMNGVFILHKNIEKQDGVAGKKLIGVPMYPHQTLRETGNIIQNVYRSCFVTSKVLCVTRGGTSIKMIKFKPKKAGSETIYDISVDKSLNVFSEFVPDEGDQFRRVCSSSLGYVFGADSVETLTDEIFKEREMCVHIEYEIPAPFDFRDFCNSDRKDDIFFYYDSKLNIKSEKEKYENYHITEEEDGTKKLYVSEKILDHFTQQSQRINFFEKEKPVDNNGVTYSQRAKQPPRRRNKTDSPPKFHRVFGGKNLDKVINNKNFILLEGGEVLLTSLDRMAEATRNELLDEIRSDLLMYKKKSMSEMTFADKLDDCITAIKNASNVLNSKMAVVDTTQNLSRITNRLIMTDDDARKALMILVKRKALKKDNDLFNTFVSENELSLQRFTISKNAADLSYTAKCEIKFPQSVSEKWNDKCAHVRTYTEFFLEVVRDLVIKQPAI